MQKREIVRTEKKGLMNVANLILVAVLLAAGVVLKMFLGASFGAMKPNFVIAMYCLAIMLIRPKLTEALIVGLLAGVLCQFFPGTPYINIVSEPIGALAMAVLLIVPMKVGKFDLHPTVGTFLATLVSGFAYVGIMYAMFYMDMDVSPTPLQLFMGIIFGTAAINAVIVQVLYLPLKAALKKE